ncbi:MAG: hypothetical protein EOO40_08950, partial [Deltaproteobacteria bacterium]
MLARLPARFVVLCATLCAAQVQAHQIPVTLDGEVAGGLASRKAYNLSSSASDMRAQFLSGGVGASGLGGGVSLY